VWCHSGHSSASLLLYVAGQPTLKKVPQKRRSVGRGHVKRTQPPGFFPDLYAIPSPNARAKLPKLFTPGTRQCARFMEPPKDESTKQASVRSDGDDEQTMTSPSEEVEEEEEEKEGNKRSATSSVAGKKPQKSAKIKAGKLRGYEAVPNAPPPPPPKVQNSYRHPDWPVGTLVWASVPGYCLWPGIVWSLDQVPKVIHGEHAVVRQKFVPGRIHHPRGVTPREESFSERTRPSGCTSVGRPGVSLGSLLIWVWVADVWDWRMSGPGCAGV
jgi:hypothetical protein